MKKYNVVLLCSVLLGALVLSSCQIDEEENLLFQLKDNLEVGGKWQASGSLNSFTFDTDGTFIFKGDSGDRDGTYVYGQVISSSIFDIEESVGLFYLRFDDNGESYDVKVKEGLNGDLYFVYESISYTQIS